MLQLEQLDLLLKMNVGEHYLRPQEECDIIGQVELLRKIRQVELLLNEIALHFIDDANGGAIVGYLHFSSDLLLPVVSPLFLTLSPARCAHS